MNMLYKKLAHCYENAQNYLAEVESLSDEAEEHDDPEQAFQRRLLSTFADAHIELCDFTKLILDDILIETTDRTPIKLRDVRQLHGWFVFRKRVVERDGGICQQCGSPSNLQVHHGAPVSIFPDRIYDMSNCITLCADCHRKRHRFVKDVDETVL
jgi:hypothetical protein